MEGSQLTIIDQLDQLEEILLDSGRLPFTGNRLVNEQEAVDLLDTIRESMPSEILKASEIAKKGNVFIKEAQNISEQIIKKARKEREQMINAAGVRKESERQITELKNFACHQSEKLLQDAKQKALLIEHEMQVKISNLETAYSSRKHELEQEYAKRHQKLEQENFILQQNYKKQIEIKNKKAMTELENYHQEAINLQKESQEEAKRIHKEALIHRQTTQQTCESMIVKARQEAFQLQEGAIQYAERTLGELEDKLYKITQIVIAGRNELGKTDSISSNKSNITHINSQKTNITFRKLRDHASKLKNNIKYRA